MTVRQIRNHGKKVWMTRAAYGDRRPALFCESKEAARQAEAELLKQLDAEAGQAEAEGQRPATLRGPYRRVHVSRVFRKAARGAGLRDFRFHDLRHDGATMALSKGFTAPIVMALGGCRTEKTMRPGRTGEGALCLRPDDHVLPAGHGTVLKWQHPDGSRTADPAPLQASA